MNHTYRALNTASIANLSVMLGTSAWSRKKSDQILDMNYNFRNHDALI